MVYILCLSFFSGEDPPGEFSCELSMGLDASWSLRQLGGRVLLLNLPARSRMVSASLTRPLAISQTTDSGISLNSVTYYNIKM